MVGHLPFSHVFEELLDEETCKKHEDLTVKYIQESEIGRILDSFPVYERSICARGGWGTHTDLLVNNIARVRVSPLRP